MRLELLFRAFLKDLRVTWATLVFSISIFSALSGLAFAGFDRPGQGYLAVASSASIEGARRIAQGYAAHFEQVEVYKTRNGYFNVVLASGEISGLEVLRAELISSGSVPADSYITSGTRFVDLVWRTNNDQPSGQGTGSLAKWVGIVSGLDPNGDNFLSLRRQPRSGSREVARMAPGEQLQIEGQKGSWLLVKRMNGQQGWAFSRYVGLQDASSLRPAFRKAKALLSEAEVERFVIDYIRQVTQADASLSYYYASSLRWYDKGMMSVGDVVRERQTIASRWPDRNNTVTQLLTKPLPNGRFGAEFVVRYELANATRTICGHWRTVLELVSDQQGQLKIVSETGGNLNKPCVNHANPGMVSVQPGAEPQKSARGTLDGSRKVALVVGINNYVHVPKLVKAVNDSRAVAGALRKIGYSVTHVENPSRRDLSSTLSRFMNGIKVGDTAFFYFAGHGVAIGPNNILLAADMPKIELGQDDIAKDEGFPVDTVVRRLQSNGAKTAFVVLDACRNNPFEAGGTRSLGATRGLGKTEAPEGVFVLYSAGMGQEAIDKIDETDSHPNSVFTRKLVDALITPGITHTSLAKQVQAEVSRLAASANMKQQPAYYDQIIGEVPMNQLD